MRQANRPMQHTPWPEITYSVSTSTPNSSERSQEPQRRRIITMPSLDDSKTALSSFQVIRANNGCIPRGNSRKWLSEGVLCNRKCFTMHSSDKNTRECPTGSRWNSLDYASANQDSASSLHDDLVFSGFSCALWFWSWFLSVMLRILRRSACVN